MDTYLPHLMVVIFFQFFWTTFYVLNPRPAADSGNAMADSGNARSLPTYLLVLPTYCIPHSN